MRTRRRHHRAGVVLAVIGGTGCVAETCTAPCSTQIDSADARYAVHLFAYTTPDDQDHGLGASYAQSTPSCAGSDGLVPGADLTLKTEGLGTHKGCQVTLAEIAEAPAPISLLGPSTDPTAVAFADAHTELMYAVEDVAIGGCSGVLVLDFFPGLNLFGQPIDGAEPPATMYRLFLPSSGSCPICEDNFEVNLQKE